MKLYVIYDKVAEESGPLFQAKNDETAKRQFIGMIKHEKVLSPGDYNLHCVGYYDHANMVLESCTAEIVLRGSEVEI